MTDTTGAGGTEPLDRTEVQREAGAIPASGATAEPSPIAAAAKDPVKAVKDPDNRAKLLLAIAALTLLNFLLLLGVLFSLDNDGPSPVTVDGRSCIIRPHDGESRLFCAD